jgi:hypothetical protein
MVPIECKKKHQGVPVLIIPSYLYIMASSQHLIAHDKGDRVVNSMSASYGL